jgi:hypothetical protein
MFFEVVDKIRRGREEVGFAEVVEKFVYFLLKVF